MRERLDLCPTQVVEANTEHAQNRESRQTMQTLHLHVYIRTVYKFYLYNIIHMYMWPKISKSKYLPISAHKTIFHRQFFVQPLIASDSVKFSDPIKFQSQKFWYMYMYMYTYKYKNDNV